MNVVDFTDCFGVEAAAIGRGLANLALSINIRNDISTQSARDQVEAMLSNGVCSPGELDPT